MKNVLVLALLFSLISFKALAVSADDSLMELKTAEKIIATLPDMGEYKPKDKDNDKVVKDQDKAFRIIEDAVKAFQESPEDQLLLEQILLVTSQMNKKDPTRWGSELVSPLVDKDRPEFKKNPALFKTRTEKVEKALKKLPPKDAADLKKSIQNVLRERREGNG
ncbi:hypothetical protein B9G69_004075 [Bdellovibrio sp. SKB1291214]|uniref:hypothetical protein n=1 Tax=Bdellovibrio sp. SKB1291214 TaxID=1732569 RepID=UPI000B720E2A|nr:hypothetical protein [Bdellovibrio sp. SKB1291214]UYL09751.1 hypothetical protein B9G69_004075 [Bdellovibrio sp. SKB1291214]